MMDGSEYYRLLRAAYARTNQNNRDSIKVYNEYARELRKQIAEDKRQSEVILPNEVNK